jgi:hypothetical protein
MGGVRHRHLLQVFPMSLYENINKRRKAGTSRPKSKSTIEPKTYAKMKSKRGGFSAKKRK